ncbi:MAG: aminopeptidase [Chloroflexota bacterium]|nr:aminopeptidase [Chloroflexota bacterium]
MDDSGLLEEVNYQQVAGRLLRECLRVQPHERVTILGRSDSLDFCEALELECRRLEALPFIVVGSDAALWSALADPLVLTETLTRPSPQLMAALTESDLVITTFFERADPHRFAALSPVRWRALRRSEEEPSAIIYDGNRRWLGTEVPTPQQAAALGCDWPSLHNLFWRAMLADYVPIDRQGQRLRERLERGTSLHLTDKVGLTDLYLEIGGRPIECDAGIIRPEEKLTTGQLYLNMPSGEVCFAPLEQSVQGRAYIRQAFWQGQPIRDLELEFKDGHVYALHAQQGLALFRDTVENGGGDAAFVGEFGIGLNPAVDRVTGFLLLDEKMLGTAHFALGENRALGGVNNSALHWDLVVQQAIITLDGDLILKDGKFLIP